MPNTPPARGGGISRKIPPPARPAKRPQGNRPASWKCPRAWALILRNRPAPTRTKVEVKRDFEYLMRLWENVRNLDAQINRAKPRLRGRQPDQALDPRPLQQRTSRRSWSPVKRGYREAKDFNEDAWMPSPRQGGSNLHGDHASDLRPLRHRGAIDKMLQPSGDAQVRRLHHHQPDRSAGCDRCQLGPGTTPPRAFHRRHGAADATWRQPTKLPVNCACATWPALSSSTSSTWKKTATHRAVEKRMKDCLKKRPGPYSGWPDFAFRPAGNVAAAHQGLGAGKHHCRSARPAAAYGHIRSQSSVGAARAARRRGGICSRNTTH